MNALTSLTHIGLEDFFLASSFSDFFTIPVGGFINNTLRGLLRVTTNYIHIMPVSTGAPQKIRWQGSSMKEDLDLTLVSVGQHL
jgi:hypothetical protein